MTTLIVGREQRVESFREPTSSPRLKAPGQLARELLDVLHFASMRSIRTTTVAAVIPAVPRDDDDDACTNELQITTTTNDDHDDDDDDEFIGTWEGEIDAPHPRDERHWFSRHEERAFELARQFDRLAPRPRHAESRRRLNKRAPASPRRSWQPAAAPSARLLAETVAVTVPDNQTVVMPPPKAHVPSPSAEDVNVQRAIAESRRQAADASRLVDAEFARACGLTPAQLAALMTRDLSANDYELLLALDNTVAAKTIKKVDDVLSAVAPGSVAADDCCMICLDEMAACPLAELASLPCKHTFHRKCIADHLGKFSRRCPIDNLSLEQ